jgi:DNA helicase-2/ATP-dependent DNA helicase PcrA
MTRARARLVLTGAARRRIFGEYQATEPSRFLGEVPSELIERIEPAFPASSGNFSYYQFRTNPYGRGGPRRGRVRDERPAFAYEDEDQSGRSLRPGARVRHAQFGLGEVLSVEELDDDTKLVVRFAAVGRKTLRAKYAKLEVV